MGNVTLPAGATDKRVADYLRDYFERHPKVTQASLSRAIGRSEAWMSRHLNGEQGWTQTDIDQIAVILDVDSLEIQRGPQAAA